MRAVNGSSWWPKRRAIGVWMLLTIFWLAPLSGLAHAVNLEAVRSGNLEQLARGWEFDPGVIISLILSAWLYWRGVARLWATTHFGCGIRPFEIACFTGGWLALVVALVSPLHAWGRLLFSAHMTQHEILMLLAAPLLVLSRPMLAFLKALPRHRARTLARIANAKGCQTMWRFITNSFVAWFLHAVTLWIWHLPALFDATIDNDLVHSLQHLSFLGSALLFWWAVIHGPRRATSYGIAVLYLFTTALHSGLLGALLTYASALWYSVYATTTQSWGLSPLDDQQLGGLIMWVPAGMVYVFAALILFVGWLREAERKVLARESQSRALAS
jgi:putative membrane protein